MATKFRKIGVLTSGGDAPGMNNAVRAITRAALASGVEVIGINGGYSGLVNDNVRTLTARDVSNIVNCGGTVLYSDRCDGSFQPGHTHHRHPLYHRQRYHFHGICHRI